jgi:predicted esterase
MQEHHLSVPRTARYFTLGGSPDGVAGVAEVWFVCHGYAQLAGRFVQHFEPLADASRLVVAPEGLSRFYLEDATVPAAERKVGATWMTREDRLSEIDDYVRYLDALRAVVLRQVGRAAVHVTALGFSQGAATVSRWAARGAAGVDRLILWAGELPPDLDLAAAAERFRGLRLLLVVGRDDAYITPKIVAREEQRLRSHGIPYEVRCFEGGHEIDEEILKEVGRETAR